MVAKVVAHGCDREEARRRLRLALRDTALLGLRTNKRFLADILTHPTFVEGGVTTGFLDAFEARRPALGAREHAIAGALWLHGDDGERRLAREVHDGWRSAGPRERPLPLLIDDTPVMLSGAVTGASSYRVLVAGAAHACAVLWSDALRSDVRVRVDVDGVQETAHAAWDQGRLFVDVGGVSFTVAAQPLGRAGAAAAGDGTLRAPMSGRVVGVDVAVGDRVARGQSLLRIESMKIESPVLCDVSGVVAEVRVSAGAQVKVGQALVVVTVEDGGKPHGK